MSLESRELEEARRVVASQKSMKTKLTRVGEHVAVLLEKPFLAQAGLHEDDEVEVSATGATITVTKAGVSEREAEFRASAERIVTRYAGLFERLSK